MKTIEEIKKAAEKYLKDNGLVSEFVMDLGKELNIKFAFITGAEYILKAIEEENNKCK